MEAWFDEIVVVAAEAYRRKVLSRLPAPTGTWEDYAEPGGADPPTAAGRLPGDRLIFVILRLPGVQAREDAIHVLPGAPTAAEVGWVA